MIKKRINLIVTIILSVVLIGLVITYHRLQADKVMFYSMDSVIRKIYPEQGGKFYNLVFDKKVQYILLTLTYAVIFHLINSLVKSVGKKSVIAVILSILFSAQIFLIDTWVNYSVFRDIYGMSNLNFKSFVSSELWMNGMSKYGIFIVVINYGFLCSLMLTMIMIRYLFTKGTPANDRMARVNGLMHEMFIIDNDIYYNNADKLTDLYNYGYISEISILDFISHLPERSTMGLKCLAYIEAHIDDNNPVIIDRIKEEYKKHYSDVEWLFEDTDKEYTVKDRFSANMDKIDDLSLESEGE